VSIVRSNRHDEHGQPYYFVKSQNQMRTYCPAKLLKEDSNYTLDDSNPKGYR
jgi:hypothetical protein